jgi:3-oxoacyl-[acyl-carrier protein] reductase
MGRAMSFRFAREGAAVVINYARSKAEAESAVAEIDAARPGSGSVAIQADVSKEADVKAMIAEIEARFGRLDILINNAGWSTRIPHHKLEDLTDEIWNRTLDTNLRGAFYCVRAAMPLLRKAPAPAIVNVASAAAFSAAGSSIVYAASKAAMVSMTKSLARAFAPQVRVNAVCPGLIRTRFAGWPEEAFEHAKEVTPVGRLVTVEEVAGIVYFLAVEATSTTGEAILADGGVYQLGRSR